MIGVRSSVTYSELPSLTYVFIFLAMLLGIWDLSSQTRDRTHTPYVGSLESYHWNARQVAPSLTSIYANWYSSPPWERKSRRHNLPPTVGRPEGSSSWESEEVAPEVKKVP